ncbi:kinase-like domain-containing protein [Biscogniauxia mediterranea]|nr:kinase-like domain-containing protein [Biscogniauxia mediterranea]
MAKHNSTTSNTHRKRKRDSTDASTDIQNRPGTTKRSKLISRAPAQPVQNENGRIYLNWPDDLEIENPERYRPGGLHPIHLGDFIDKNGRFQVLHKLGHGDESTIWLCYDSQECLLKAVKILSADESTERSSELRISAIFSNTPRQELDENHIALPLEHFWIEGPNGRHLCTVSEFLAAKACIPPPGVGQHTEDDLNEICFQICKGIQYLHGHGVCHGDIRKENFAMELDFRGTEIHDLLEQLEEPFMWDLHTISGRSPQPWGPKYIVSQPSMRTLERRFGTGRLMLMDFGLAYPASKPPKQPNFYRSNAAPELLFGMGSKGKATDIWALGSVMCELVRGRWICDEFDKYPVFIRRLESTFGPFPASFKRGVYELLEGYEDSRRRDRLPPAQHRASRTRSGRSYQPDGPMTLGYNMEGYKQEMKDYEKRTGWPNRMQGFLSYRQQCYRYWERINVPIDEQDDDKSESETSMKGSDTSRDGASSESQDQDTEMKSRSPTRSIQQKDEMPPCKRQVKSDLGTWPDPENPCTCYKREEDGFLSRSDTLCDARDHYIYDPDQTTIFALTKDEVICFSDLLLRIFRYDPKERLTIDEIINHEWFAKVKSWHDKPSPMMESGEESDSS